MDKSKILSEIQEILRDVLDEPTVVLAETTTPTEVNGWDSMAHLQLIVAIEKHFGINFNSNEILSWRSVGEMLNSIVSKVG